MLADRLRPRSCPLLTPVVCTPVAPAQTVDQRPATNVQGDPDTDKNKKTRREVCARWPPAPALLPAADSRCATLLQRLAMNTFGPTTNNQGYEHYEGFYPNMYKGEVFFCLCCERKNDFVRGIAGPELEELQRTNSFECLGELIKYQGVIDRADQFVMTLRVSSSLPFLVIPTLSPKSWMCRSAIRCMSAASAVAVFLVLGLGQAPVEGARGGEG